MGGEWSVGDHVDVVRGEGARDGAVLDYKFLVPSMGGDGGFIGCKKGA